jgi:hypothetical protein
MMFWALRVNLAVFGVFLTLEVTEILLTIGFFRVAHGGSAWMLHAGGWAGIVTAAGGLVHSARRRDQRDVALAGASGRTAAVREALGGDDAGCTDGERASGLGCTR